MKKGFNWGQLFHALQLEFQDNGFAPKEFRAWLQKVMPKAMLKHVRFSGTMSNTMLIDRPGYDHLLHTQQIRNQRREQPQRSYLYAFVELYRQLQCEDLSFTINTHVPFASGTKEDLMLMMESFKYVYSHCKVVAIELENESYYYHSITGAAGGIPNFIERIQLAGGLLQALNNRNVENGMRARVNRYLDFLEFTVAPLFKEYMLPMGISVGNPTNMRERIWNEEVLKRDFYQFVIPHIYLTVENYSDIEAEVKRQLDAVRKPAVGIHVTEFNWNYQAAPAGPVDEEAFRRNFFSVLEKQGVEAAYFHCLSQSSSAYSWVRR